MPFQTSYNLVENFRQFGSMEFYNIHVGDIKNYPVFSGNLLNHKECT